MVPLQDVGVDALQVLLCDPRVIRFGSALPSDQVTLIALAPGSDGLVIQDTLDPLSSLRYIWRWKLRFRFTLKREVRPKWLTGYVCGFSILG